MITASTAAILGLVGTGLSVVGSAAYMIWKSVVARRALNNTPAMQANLQAGADTALEEKAKNAISAADSGKPGAEEIGDAE